MINTVIKRDGREKDFNPKNIRSALEKAFISADGAVNDDAEVIINRIINQIVDLNKTKISVEDIQNMIENKLMQSSRKDVAKAYILYRNERTKVRERNSQLIKSVSEKLMATNVQNQNANVDEKSFGGRMGEANDAVMKQYALDYCMSEMAKNNHLNNEIYIHDLAAYAVGMHNCITIPFDKLLANGFNTRQTDVRPAQSVSTAFQLVAVIFQLQSLQQFGGVSAGAIDHTMVPYVRRSFAKHFKTGIKYILRDDEYAKIVPSELSFNDIEANCEQNKSVYKYAMDMTEKEVYQAVEGMYHNLK